MYCRDFRVRVVFRSHSPSTHSRHSQCPVSSPLSTPSPTYRPAQPARLPPARPRRSPAREHEHKLADLNLDADSLPTCYRVQPVDDCRAAASNVLRYAFAKSRRLSLSFCTSLSIPTSATHWVCAKLQFNRSHSMGRLTYLLSRSTRGRLSLASKQRARLRLREVSTTFVINLHIAVNPDICNSSGVCQATVQQPILNGQAYILAIAFNSWPTLGRQQATCSATPSRSLDDFRYRLVHRCQSWHRQLIGCVPIYNSTGHIQGAGCTATARMLQTIRDKVSEILCSV
jgi:hypothetical protein